MTRFEFPVLVNVADWTVEVVPTLTLPNVRVSGLLGGVVVIEATAPAPVPETGTVWGLGVFEALSAMLMSALTVPTAVGAKSTAMVHVALFGPTVPPETGQVVVASNVNGFGVGVLVNVMLEMLRVPVPEFVSVTFIGEEVVPTF